MTNVAGSIEEVTLNGRPFAVAADADANIKIGGFENEVLGNGNGTARIIKTRVPLAISGLQLETDEARGDAEFLQDLADAKDFFPIALRNVSGTTWQGTAMLTGENQRGTQTGTTSVDLMGPGKLTRQ